MILCEECTVCDRDASGREVRVTHPVGTECRAAAASGDGAHPEAKAIHAIVQEHRSKGEKYLAVMLGGRPRAIPASCFKGGANV